MIGQRHAVCCRVCGETGDERVFSGWLHRCRTCGFTWTAGTGEASQADLYDDGYFLGGGYADYFSSAPARRLESRRRLEWLLSAARPQSLLEAGAAAGFFVEAARAAGIAATGVEPAGACVRFATEQLGVPVRQGLFEPAMLDSTVQAVCAFHVLEHVDDPRAFMATAWDALDPGGWLAVEVPNIASDVAVRHDHRWFHLDLFYHRWHFSPESLTRLARNAGFRVRRCDTVYSRHYLTRRERWFSARGRSMLLTDSLARGVPCPRTTHPRRGDLLRLLAQRPERS